jgi:type IV pilus assembly protein PilW
MHKTPAISTAQRSRSRGFSLVELLVAAAIGIIASLAIFQVFAVFEGQKRTTISGGEAQTSGTLALFTVERELRQAGYGINNLEFLGCKIVGYDSITATPFNLELLPVRITQGALGAPDTITVMYGNGELLPNPANFTQNMPNESSDYKVGNRYGFEEGNIVIAAEAGKDCTLAQVSNLPGGLGQTENVIHNPGTYTDPATGTQKDIRYNPSAFPPGSGIAYTINAKLFNLGGLPANNIYSIQSGQLTLQQALFAASPPAATPLYDGVVQLQAQYGKDDGINNGTVTIPTYAAGDGIIDNFSDASPASAAQWAQVFAVRLAVVVRSNLREKADPDGVCRITTAAPSWAGGAISLVADPDWQCYRYKVFQTVVPIRNMIWRP